MKSQLELLIFKREVAAFGDEGSESVLAVLVGEEMQIHKRNELKRKKHSF